jgi:hypothetical protein
MLSVFEKRYFKTKKSEHTDIIFLVIKMIQQVLNAIIFDCNRIQGDDLLSIKTKINHF